MKFDLMFLGIDSNNFIRYGLRGGKKLFYDLVINFHV